MAAINGIIIRLEARLQPNTEFTSQRVLIVFTPSAITMPKVNRFGWNLEHSECIVCDWSPADFERNLRRSDSGSARRSFVWFFCEVSNARFHRFPVGQISRNLHTTRQSVRRWIFSTQNVKTGRSLCVQISRERSYPLPIYWYHSKGNWLRYNFAAESFYIMKLLQQTVRPLLSTMSKRRQI